MTTTNRRPLASRDTRWARALSVWLVRRRVSPNGISVAGMAFATLGAAGYLLSGSSWLLRLLLFILAAASIQARLVCNLLDGMVAIEGGLKGRAGGLFNEAPDRYADFVLLAAAGIAAGNPALGWIAAAAAVLTAYVRALGASLDHEQDFCGPMAKQQRMFFLTVGTLGASLYLPVLLWTLALIAAGGFATAVRRTMRLYSRLP